jgi:hypothetical protein
MASGPPTSCSDDTPGSEGCTRNESPSDKTKATIPQTTEQTPSRQLASRRPPSIGPVIAENRNLVQHSLVLKLTVDNTEYVGCTDPDVSNPGRRSVIRVQGYSAGKKTLPGVRDTGRSGLHQRHLVIGLVGFSELNSENEKCVGGRVRVSQQTGDIPA